MWILAAVLAVLNPQVPKGEPSPASAPTIAEALDAYSRRLARIRTIEAEFGEYESLDGGATWAEIGRYWVWKDGPRNRFRRWSSQLIDMGGNRTDLDTWSDRSWSPEEVRSIDGNGRHFAARLSSPRHLYEGPFASLMKPSDLSMSRLPDAMLMLSTSFDHDFAEDVRRDPNAAISVVGEPGRRRVEVRFVETFRKGLSMTYLATLDPALGDAIRRVEYWRTPGGPSTGVAEVETFEEVEPGLFFPTRIRISEPGGRTIERRAITLKVNGPIDPGSLVVEFPEGAAVSAMPLETTHIWGAGGPRRTFRTRKDFDVYRDRVTGLYQLPSLLGFGLLAALLLGIAATRRGRDEAPAPRPMESTTSRRRAWPRPRFSIAALWFWVALVAANCYFIVELIRTKIPSSILVVLVLTLPVVNTLAIGLGCSTRFWRSGTASGMTDGFPRPQELAPCPERSKSAPNWNRSSSSRPWRWPASWRPSPTRPPMDRCWPSPSWPPCAADAS